MSPPAADFLGGVWGLVPAGTSGGTQFFRGTGESSVHPVDRQGLGARGRRDHVFRLREEIGKTGQARTDFVRRARRRQGPRDARAGEPELPLHRGRPTSNPSTDRDKPIQLTHAVLNSADQEASRALRGGEARLQVSDRTAHMRFLRCNRKHHCVAYAQVGARLAQPHRLRDEGRGRGDARHRAPARGGLRGGVGAGRHGPGNNVFGYFIAPYGGVIEYTAEVSRGRRRLQGRHAGGLEVAARAHRPLGPVEEGHGEDRPRGGRAALQEPPLMPSSGISFA